MIANYNCLACVYSTGVFGATIWLSTYLLSSPTHWSYIDRIQSAGVNFLIFHHCSIPPLVSWQLTIIHVRTLYMRRYAFARISHIANIVILLLRHYVLQMCAAAFDVNQLLYFPVFVTGVPSSAIRKILWSL
jgi:hypothetical protein